MSSDLTPEEARKMYLASLAYFTDGEHLKPKDPTPNQLPQYTLTR